MLPPFRIRNLRASNHPTGSDLGDDFSYGYAGEKDDTIVQITLSAYDTLITDHPDATLRYIDEDDGEVVTVGSSMELLQRLEEPVAASCHKRRPSPVAASNLARSSRSPLTPVSSTMHVFDIDPSTSVNHAWQSVLSDHASNVGANQQRTPQHEVLNKGKGRAKDQHIRQVADYWPPSSGSSSTVRQKLPFLSSHNQHGTAEIMNLVQPLLNHASGPTESAPTRSSQEGSLLPQLLQSNELDDPMRSCERGPSNQVLHSVTTTCEQVQPRDLSHEDKRRPLLEIFEEELRKRSARPASDTATNPDGNWDGVTGSASSDPPIHDIRDDPPHLNPGEVFGNVIRSLSGGIQLLAVELQQSLPEVQEQLARAPQNVPHTIDRAFQNAFSGFGTQLQNVAQVAQGSSRATREAADRFREADVRGLENAILGCQGFIINGIQDLGDKLFSAARPARSPQSAQHAAMPGAEEANFGTTSQTQVSTYQTATQPHTNNSSSAALLKSSDSSGFLVSQAESSNHSTNECEDRQSDSDTKEAAVRPPESSLDMKTFDTDALASNTESQRRHRRRRFIRGDMPYQRRHESERERPRRGSPPTSSQDIPYQYVVAEPGTYRSSNPRRPERLPRRDFHYNHRRRSRSPPKRYPSPALHRPHSSVAPRDDARPPRSPLIRHRQSWHPDLNIERRRKENVVSFAEPECCITTNNAESLLDENDSTLPLRNYRSLEALNSWYPPRHVANSPTERPSETWTAPQPSKLAEQGTADGTRPSGSEENFLDSSPESTMTRFPALSQFERSTRPPVSPSLPRDQGPSAVALASNNPFSQTPQTSASGGCIKRTKSEAIPGAWPRSRRGFRDDSPSTHTDFMPLRRSHTAHPARLASPQPGATLAGPFDPLEEGHVMEGSLNEPMTRDETQHTLRARGVPSFRRPYSEMYPSHTRIGWESFLESYERIPGQFPTEEERASSDDLEIHADGPFMTSQLPPGAGLDAAQGRAACSPNTSEPQRENNAPSKISECIKMLSSMGFGGIQDGGAERLLIYAQAADGDLESAIEIIEEDQKATLQRRA
ncbi:MAG: hypothetical protein M1833_004196 [Piccolia ochrophora]|nr:MAG: hypothetical protein M1833_004196 [Piccolia ochrophora]